MAGRTGELALRVRVPGDRRTAPVPCGKGVGQDVSTARTAREATLDAVNGVPAAWQRMADDRPDAAGLPAMTFPVSLAMERMNRTDQRQTTALHAPLSAFDAEMRA